MDSTFPVAILRRITGSNDEYKCIQLDSNVISVGRSKENSYTIADLLVSRKHAVFRFKNNQWTVESVGMNGIAVNHVQLPKNQEILIHHMDSIEFGAGSKFVYTFRMQQSGAAEEPVAKKMRLPLANRNYPSINESPEAFRQWVKSRKSLEKTLVEENDNIDVKLERQTSLKERLLLEQEKLNLRLETTKKDLEMKFAREKTELEEKVVRGELEKTELQQEKEVLERRMLQCFQEFQAEKEKKTTEFEESITRANMEKQALIEQKEFIVQQLTIEKDVLQEKLQEESRLREATMHELAQLKESRQILEQELKEARNKMNDEIQQHKKKGSEDETRFRQMQEELADREAQLTAKEREVADIQSRAAIGLEMYESMQIIHQEQASGGAGNGIMILLDQGQSIVQPSVAEIELERVREELRVQKALNEQQQRASNKACIDIVDQMENIMENELQCGICSELYVFATSLGCMHTFCQLCIAQWKKNKNECPVCRTPIITEGRNLLVDNMIDAMVCKLSEELRNRRKELVKQRKELITHPAAQQRDVTNAGRGQNISIEVVQIPENFTNGRGRPRRSTNVAANIRRAAVPGAAPPPPPPTQARVISIPTQRTPRARTTGSVVRPSRLMIPSRSGSFQAIAPVPQFPTPNVGPAIPPASTTEEVVLSSGSDSSSEESHHGRSEVIDLSGGIINPSRTPRWTRRRNCNTCGRILPMNGRGCVSCGS